MSNDYVYQALVELAADYEMFQCELCADAIEQWLTERQITGTRLMIQTFGNDFMISARVGPHQSITQNGRHFGIEVGGHVFDNLYPTGIEKQVWLDDFECINGFTVYETPF